MGIMIPINTSQDYSGNNSEDELMVGQHQARFYFILFIYSSLALLGRCCCARAFLSCGVTPHFSARVSHFGGFSCCGAGLLPPGLQQLQHLGSVVMAHGLSCSGRVGSSQTRD